MPSEFERGDRVWITYAHTTTIGVVVLTHKESLMLAFTLTLGEYIGIMVVSRETADGEYRDAMFGQVAVISRYPS